MATAVGRSIREVLGVPFRYQLQRVLTLIEKKEKEADAKVMAAVARRDGEQAVLRELDTRKDAAAKGLNAQMAAGATPDVAASNDYIQMLGLKMEAQQKKVAEAQKSLDEAKELQTQVRKERTKLEKHKEMKFDEWKIEEKKRDARRIDEMAGTIFLKKRNLLEEENAELADRLEKLEKLKLLREMRDRREKESRF